MFTKYLNKEEVMEKFTLKNGIEKREIENNEKYLKEISQELNNFYGMTHQEIAKEFGAKRIKITRLINKKWTRGTSPLVKRSKSFRDLLFFIFP